MELQLNEHQIDTWQTSSSLFEQNNALSDLDVQLSVSDKLVAN
ncbi:MULTISPECIES: hypothetical protein [unclassified Pseudoalteromonas]|nr:hypothetical protein [Pseudoalteromonas sp. BSi20495]GAA80572.1 hypothetical protein P20495_3087 [Pseudoalteromonas sp. BSi20495]